MRQFLDIALILILLSNFLIAGTNRLYQHIRLIAFQGILLSIVPILVHARTLNVDTWIIAGGNFIVMAVLAPWMLRQAVRHAEIQEDLTPYVGYVASLVLGLVMVSFSFFLFAKIHIVSFSHVSHLLPYAMINVLFGLFLIITRKKALTQVIGYIVLSNGVGLFGVGLAAEQPLLVEMGILLDAFFAVLVMGIGIYHISVEFDSIDASKLDSLRDNS